MPNVIEYSPPNKSLMLSSKVCNYCNRARQLQAKQEQAKTTAYCDSSAAMRSPVSMKNGPAFQYLEFGGLH